MGEEIGSPDKLQPLDISAHILGIIDDRDNPLPRVVRVNDLMKSEEVKNAPALRVVLPWRSIETAKWAKAWLEGVQGSQERQIAIVCTRREMMSVANIFASGVKWIDSEAASQS